MSKSLNIYKRRQERELAFAIIFEKTFSEDSVEDIIERAVESREIEPSVFASNLSCGVYSSLEEIDGEIEKYSIGWQLSRISRISLSILRLSIYEMKFLSDEIPYSVSINEAVEIAKKYGGNEDPAFINGILSSFLKSFEEA